MSAHGSIGASRGSRRYRLSHYRIAADCVVGRPLSAVDNVHYAEDDEVSKPVVGAVGVLRRWWWVAIPVAVAAVVVVNRSRPPTVAVVRPRSVPVVQTITLSGRVAGLQESVVAPEAAGVLAELLVEDGDRVERGSLLGRVSTDVASAQLMQAIAAVETAQAQLSALASELERVARALPDSAYCALPTAVIHGDWHPANIKFSGDTVTGIFDFDWFDRQPRMVDVADGMLFFCGVRPHVDGPGDIWSLTGTPELRLDRMRAFMQGYGSRIRPTAEELQALPDLMAVRWIYARVDAADRKIEQPDQVRFILRDVLSPLQWIAEHRGKLAEVGWWE
ncbi:MAG TPA: hypothetical protein DGT21_18425 [Armatimonadetes bacterium]|nr:hypothetical protein [Armatimonadota bacterium]